MTRHEALTFLNAHQPLPRDDLLTQELIDTYDEVRRYVAVHADVECLGPFLGAFGDGDGLGVYQLAPEALRGFSHDALARELNYALTSAHRGVVYWAAQLAAEFPARELVANLLQLLDRGDSDVSYAAVTALEHSADASIVQRLSDFAASVVDEELRELALDVAKRLQGRSSERQ